MVIEMSYKIILDSCGELPAEYKADARFENVPLGLEVGDYQIMDDENFNQKEKRILQGRILRLRRVAAATYSPSAAVRLLFFTIWEIQRTFLYSKKKSCRAGFSKDHWIA